MVFENLIFNYAHSCFVNSKLCQAYTSLVCSNCGSSKDFVDLFLRVSGKNFLCLPYSGKLCF